MRLGWNLGIPNSGETKINTMNTLRNLLIIIVIAQFGCNGNNAKPKINISGYWYFIDNDIYAEYHINDSKIYYLSEEFYMPLPGIKYYIIDSSVFIDTNYHSEHYGHNVLFEISKVYNDSITISMKGKQIALKKFCINYAPYKRNFDENLENIMFENRMVNNKIVEGILTLEHFE